MERLCHWHGPCCLTRILWRTLNCSAPCTTQLWRSLVTAATILSLWIMNRQAIKALRQVFPQSRIRGCSFHFRQAIYRRVQHESLKAQYEDETSPIRRWIRQLLAMSALPEFVVPLAWSWLSSPPSVDPLTDVKTCRLAEYFESTWIQGDFPPTLWTHFDNARPTLPKDSTTACIVG